MNIRHYILLLSLLSLTLTSFGQEGFFSWSAGSAEQNLAFMDMEVMDDHSIVAVAQIDERGNRGQFLAPNGKEINLDLRRSGTVIMRFSPEGEILWHKSISQSSGGVYQIEKNAVGEIILLTSVEVTVNYSGEEDEVESFGSLPSLGLGVVKAGCHILHLGVNGNLIKDVYIPVLDEIEVEECRFRSYINGQYLITGTGDAEELSKRLEIPQKGDGNEYVLAIDEEGKLVWGDIIFYRNSGGYIVGSRDITFSPDGTIYYAGTYPYGATFSNGLQTLVPVNYEESQKNSNPFEGFIISYSASGAINWIKREDCTSIMGAITANDMGVFVSHRTNRNKLFGEIVDTTGRKNLGISFLNKEGNTQWTLMTGVDKIESMRIDPQGNALMLGTFRVKSGYFHNNGKIGPFTIPEKNESFLTTISPDGNVLWLKSADLWITTQNEPFIMAMDGDDSIFIAGMMWLSLPFPINRLDPSLPALKASGGVSIIGRVR